MIVRGRVIDGKPFFRAWIRSEEFHGFLWLMADTGAARTTILDHHARAMRIPPHVLVPAGPMTGLGGVVSSFRVPDAWIAIGASPVALVRNDLYLAHHDLHRFAPHDVARILRLPAIMGRDIIDHFRFVYERATGTVLLER